MYLNNFKVYHFGSIVTRKYKNHPTIKTESGSRGGKIFLLKWGITINFFKNFILNSDSSYMGELKSPKKTINYFLQLFICTKLIVLLTTATKKKIRITVPDILNNPITRSKYITAVKKRSQQTSITKSKDCMQIAVIAKKDTYLLGHWT